MNDVENITTIAVAVFTDIVRGYEENGTLPNFFKTDDSQGISISLGKIANNFTAVMNVVKHNEDEYYLDLTAYFNQEDYIGPEGSSRENAIFIIKGAPYERVFNNVYEVTGENFTEAFIDAFYVLIDQMENIVSLISGQSLSE